MKNKKQDPMPPPDATPEEIGEFWDTHDLADYWDETYEVEIQVITIGEPERSLHPGALTDIANVLEKIAERTQVVITTHSSQLLDTFSSESLSNWLGVLLLHNPSGLGTEVINIEELRHEREALDSWIIDFGVGSAIFYSELLQDLMEGPECQA